MFAQEGGLSYWDLHVFLLVPTLLLLTAGKPRLLDQHTSSTLYRDASLAFIGFITFIAVAQAFLWDSVGAAIGIWEFNSAKCTGLGDAFVLPLEEILWLFHHVMKAALWQLKIADFTIARQEGPAPAPLPGDVRVAGNVLLAALGACGVAALMSDVRATARAK